jgi:hypothetical protein
MAASITSHPAPPPYILGGVAFGAVLAAEVARRMAAGDIAGVVLLDPPAGPEEVLRTRDRLAKARVLRPAQGGRIEAAAGAVGGYGFGAWSRRMVRSVVVVVPERREEAQGRWAGWLPGAEVRVVEGAVAGGFLRFPSVSFDPCCSLSG